MKKKINAESTPEQREQFRIDDQDFQVSGKMLLLKCTDILVLEGSKRRRKSTYSSTICKKCRK
jgi:hypothetical protein